MSVTANPIEITEFAGPLPFSAVDGQSLLDQLTVKDHIEITHNAWLVAPIARHEDSSEIAENRLITRFRIQVDNGAPEFYSASHGREFIFPDPEAFVYELTEPTPEKLEIVKRRYPRWHSVERWIQPLPDAHGRPDIQAANKAVYREWNCKLNKIAKEFSPTDRHTFGVHNGGNCGRCGSELFFVPCREGLSKTSLSYKSPLRTEQCADCGKYSPRSRRALPFRELRQKAFDLDAFDENADLLNSNAGRGVSLGELLQPHGGYQEIFTTFGAKLKKRKPAPEWFGISQSGRVLSFNDRTLEVVYQMFPLLRQEYRILSKQDQLAHREQMQEAAEVVSTVRRFYFLGMTDEQIGDELELDPGKVKAMRRSFIDMGNFLHSVANDHRYQAKLRFTKSAKLTKKEFESWQITMHSRDQKTKPLVCDWLPDPFNCQRADKLITVTWQAKKSYEGMRGF